MDEATERLGEELKGRIRDAFGRSLSIRKWIPSARMRGEVLPDQCRARSGTLVSHSASAMPPRCW